MMIETDERNRKFIAAHFDTMRSRVVDKSLPENQARYTTVYNTRTGKAVVVDAYKVRYDRMRGRVVNWAGVMSKLDQPGFQKMLSLTYDVNGTKLDPTDWKPDDITKFERSLFGYLRTHFPAIIIYGYAWVGEIQPNSKHYHYHLVLVTSKRLHFANGKVFKLWAKGFVKVTVARSPFYLVSYVKKKDQKDYFYFPRGARGFHVWVNPDAMSGGSLARLKLRFDSLKWWQVAYLQAHMVIDEQAHTESIDMSLLKGLPAPPSEWVYAGSYYSLENAQLHVLDLMGFIPDGAAVNE